VSVAVIAISVLLAVLLAFAAIRKLSHRPQVVASYARAGVPERWLNPLAAVLLAAAAGLVVGLAWPPLSVVTAAMVVVYFIVAITFHVRAKDHSQLATPIVIEALALATLILALLSI
jgi:hypothetical protein